jgi:hypothetical protein
MCGEFGLVAPDVLDEALGVLAPDKDIDRVAERASRGERVVDHRIDDHERTMAVLCAAVELAGKDDGRRSHASAPFRAHIARGGAIPAGTSSLPLTTLSPCDRPERPLVTGRAEARG